MQGSIIKRLIDGQLAGLGHKALRTRALSKSTSGPLTLQGYLLPVEPVQNKI